MSAQTTERDIAVIGLACRFPGANDPSEYWHNLINGVESLIELDLDLLATDKNVMPFAAPLNCDVMSFDADFFGISAREATLMDPQHRLFIECAWHALESCGIVPGHLPDTGLFAGCSNSSYVDQFRESELMEKFKPSRFELQITNDKDYLASRVAWHMGIEGPVMGVQAACATSLVAVAEAVAALREGRCKLALAGACTVRVPQLAPYKAQQGMIYSRNGRCMPFSSGASGTVFGSGVGLVVLKPLTAALAEGNRVLAVIKGCAINNDGSNKVGFSATSVSGQKRLLMQAMNDAQVIPSDFRAVEAHGTGTIAGDPIEFDALQSIFAEKGSVSGICALGAVKANVGHLETCAGMAGLIKAVLEIEHGWITPQINVDEVNPSISLKDSPFYIPSTAERWGASDSRTLIGVSAFGIGGTNANVVLARPSSYHRKESTAPQSYPAFIPVSAKSESSWYRLVKAYQHELFGSRTHELARSAQTTRKPFRYRGVLEVDVSGSMIVREGVVDTGRRRPRVIFQFPGQGSQFLGMANGLAASNPNFATLLSDNIELLKRLVNVDVSFLLDENGKDHNLLDTALAQPALVAVEIALARFLMQYGIVPDGVIGHSLGEIAAAAISGMLTDEQALLFAAQRGLLMSRLPTGAMLAVGLNENECCAWLADDISLAAINGDHASVFSGESCSIARLERVLKQRAVWCRTLSVSHAFHSSMMDPVLDELRSSAPRAGAQQSDIRFYSTLLGGELAEGAKLDSLYWARHAREPVRFQQALEAIPDVGRTLFIEVGPGAVLTSLSMSLRPHDQSVRSLRGERDVVGEINIWHLALQKLWMAGIDIDWGPSWSTQDAITSLPKYPFDLHRYGIAPPSETDRRTRVAPSTSYASAVCSHRSLDEAVDSLWEKATGALPSTLYQQLVDAGGDSLTSVQLVVLVESELGFEISLSDFMHDPTPSGLRNCLIAAGAGKVFGMKNSGEEIQS